VIVVVSRLIGSGEKHTGSLLSAGYEPVIPAFYWPKTLWLLELALNILSS
jgi:hypothetical protein